MTPGSAVATTGSSGPLRYRVRDDPQRAKEVANDYKSAVMAGVMENLPPGVIWSVRWSKSVYPSVDNPEVYAGLPVGGLEKILDPEIRRLMFLDDAAATLLERSDGVWPAIERDDAPPHNTAGRKSYSKGAGAPYPPGSAAPSIPRTSSLFSASELLQLFEEQVMPAQIQASSRSAYWTGWKQVLTFGLAHGELDKLLPMTVATLKSLTAEFLLVGVTANSIKNLWSAIEHRHRLAHLPSPLAQRMAFKRTFKAVCAVRGAPSRLLFPIGTHHLARMLALVDLSPAQQRSVLIVAVGTASCCRVAEVGNFQMCDLLWDLDATFHRDLTGGLAIRVWKRKQDTGRFGLYPRIPPGQLVARLWKFV